MKNQPEDVGFGQAAFDTLLRELRAELLKAMSACGQGYGGTSLVMCGKQLGILICFHPNNAQPVLMGCHEAVKRAMTQAHGEPEEETVRVADVEDNPDSGRN